MKVSLVLSNIPHPRQINLSAQQRRTAQSLSWRQKRELQTAILGQAATAARLGSTQIRVQILDARILPKVLRGT